MSRFVPKDANVEIFSSSFDKLFSLENCRIYIVSISSDVPFTAYINNVEIANNATFIDAETIATIEKMQKIVELIDTPCGKCLKFKTSVKTRIQDSPDPLEFITVKYIVDKKYKIRVKDAKLDATSADTNAADIEANHENARSKWVDKQILMANKIWQEVRDALLNADFRRLSEKQQLNHFQTEYSEFNRQHPLCVRYMVQFQSFRKKAFCKYVNGMSHAPLNDKEKFYELQANYIKLLWCENNPKFGAKQASKVYNDAYNLIKTEADAFKANQDTAEELATVVDSRFSHERRVELQQQIDEMREEQLMNTAIDEFLESRKKNKERMLNRKIAGDESDDEDVISVPDFSKLSGEKFFDKPIMQGDAEAKVAEAMMIVTR